MRGAGAQLHRADPGKPRVRHNGRGPHLQNAELRQLRQKNQLVDAEEKRYEVNFKTTKAINGADTFVVEITTENGAKVASTETPFSVKDWTEGKTGRLDVPSATKKSAEELNIVVTFYDEDGNVLAYAEDFLAV